jgi:hypothetical protein
VRAGAAKRAARIGSVSRALEYQEGRRVLWELRRVFSSSLFSNTAWVKAEIS